MNTQTSVSARVPGVVLVATAAALWGSDAILRRFLTVGDVSASVLVMLEHVILVVVTLPFLLRVGPALRRFNRGDWVSAILIGGGASILATTLFTKAFSYGDFIAPALLQKLQPVFAVLLAAVVLGERLMRRYWFFFGGGVLGAFLIAFPEPTSISITQSNAALLGVSAAALWGMGTVLGRRLTPKVPFAQLTALRFAIGLPIGALVVALQGDFGEVAVLTGQQWWAVLWLALIPGGAGLLIYYRGLGRTSASAATLAELAFPLTALLYGWVFLGQALNGLQLTGVVVLIGVITTMGMGQAKAKDAGIGVVLGDDEGAPALV